MEVERTGSPLAKDVVDTRLRGSPKAKAEKTKAEKKAVQLKVSVASFVPLIQRTDDVRTGAVEEARKYLEFPDWDCIEAARRAARRLLEELV